MKKKRVWRYYCDFCKKAGCSGYHLRRHEERCTMNPNRLCGMCGLLAHNQPSLASIIALLPDPEKFKTTITDDEAWDGIFSDLAKAVSAVFPRVRRAARECPTCILAALRQAKIPVPMVSEFDYSKESKAIHDAFYQDLNEDAA